jgi:hypothetical protein
MSTVSGGFLRGLTAAGATCEDGMLMADVGQPRNYKWISTASLAKSG